MSQTIIGQQMTQMLQMILFGWAVMLAADEKKALAVCGHWSYREKNCRRFFLLSAVRRAVLAVSGACKRRLAAQLYCDGDVDRRRAVSFCVPALVLSALHLAGQRHFILQQMYGCCAVIPLADAVSFHFATMWSILEKNLPGVAGICL